MPPTHHQLTTVELALPNLPLTTGFPAWLVQDRRMRGVSQQWYWKGTERGYWTMGGEAPRRGDRLAAGSLWRSMMRKGYMSVVPFTPILHGHRKKLASGFSLSWGRNAKRLSEI